MIVLYLFYSAFHLFFLPVHQALVINPFCDSTIVLLSCTLIYQT